MPQTGNPPRITDWIVVANEATAMIYARMQKRGPLERLATLHNDAARTREAELQSDRQGRSFDSHGQGRHAMTREKSGPKRHAAETFARDVAARLSKAMHEDQCERYALVAAPRFLGMLRRALDRHNLPAPFLTVDKDVVVRSEETIRKLLD